MIKNEFDFKYNLDCVRRLYDSDRIYHVECGDDDHYHRDTVRATDNKTFCCSACPFWDKSRAISIIVWVSQRYNERDMVVCGWHSDCPDTSFVGIGVLHHHCRDPFRVAAF